MSLAVCIVAFAAWILLTFAVLYPKLASGMYYPSAQDRITLLIQFADPLVGSFFSDVGGMHVHGWRSHVRPTAGGTSS